jgi:hypothetical protein
MVFEKGSFQPACFNTPSQVAAMSKGSDQSTRGYASAVAIFLKSSRLSHAI